MQLVNGSGYTVEGCSFAILLISLMTVLNTWTSVSLCAEWLKVS